jgi:hypothetical protein
MPRTQSSVGVGVAIDDSVELGVPVMTGTSATTDVAIASDSDVIGTVLNCVSSKLSDERSKLEADATLELTVKVEIGTAIASPEEGLQTGAVNRGTSLPGWAHSSQQLVNVSCRLFARVYRNGDVLAERYLAVIRSVEAFELRTISLGWPS